MFRRPSPVNRLSRAELLHEVMQEARRIRQRHALGAISAEQAAEELAELEEGNWRPPSGLAEVAA